MAITDLTGYTWTSNTGYIEATSFPYWGNAPISINFTYNNQNYTSMYQSSDDLCFGISSSNYIRVYDGDIGNWLVTPPLVVEFTGGTGVTDSSLIAWLEANGTLTAPQPTANTYTITHTLTNVTKGNITLQLTPDTGYELPDTITVTNGTLVSYDKTTGIAVISGDDNTSVSAECVASVPSGMTIKIAGAYEIYQPYYILNGGSATYLPDANITSVRYPAKSDIDAVALTLTNVVSLSVGGEAADGRDAKIYDSNFNVITVVSIPSEGTEDITQYLQDNCYVVIWGRD